LNNKVKIGSIILLTSVLGIVFSLSFIIDSSKIEEIKFIELQGNYHLSQNEYMKFVYVENQDNYNMLSSKIIKDRFEKHPYVERVDLLLTENTLSVEIFEKNFIAFLMIAEKEYLISDNAVIIPKLPYSENIDYPIINDPRIDKDIVEFSKATTSNDIKLGLKIIAALKIVDPKLYENLSEVNLRSGKDIILQFSNLDIPVVLGRKNEIEKVILLEKLLKKLDYTKIENSLTYTDLRHSKYLYIGKSNLSNDEQESNT